MHWKDAAKKAMDFIEQEDMDRLEKGEEIEVTISTLPTKLTDYVGQRRDAP